jgi:small subunit ribosomal protein S8
MRDVVSDMLTRIRNGQKANLLEVPLFCPTSKLCINILEVLEDEGFIRGFSNKIINGKTHLVVFLKYDD